MTQRSVARIHPDIHPCNVQGKAGRNRPGQMVCCSHPDCQRKVRVTLTQARISPRDVWAFAAQRRWKIDEANRTYLCPDHGARQ